MGSKEEQRKQQPETIAHDEEDIISKKDRIFLAWLRANGARFDSVDWPSSKTESTVRGAVARADIATGVRRNDRHYYAIFGRTADAEFETQRK